MKQNIKIALMGGGGRTGYFLVNQLLAKGYRLKLLLRNPADFNTESPYIEIIYGDALDPVAVRSLLQGCQIVINTLSQRKDQPLVASQATINVLEAMAGFGIKRYLLVAGLNIDTPSDKKGPETSAAGGWMKTNFPTIHADRQKCYSVLTESKVDWTLLRVPFINFTGAGGRILADLEDCPGSKISAADIAGFLIGQLADPTFIRKAPFIANA